MPIKRLPNEISAADSSRVNLSTSEMVPGIATDSAAPSARWRLAPSWTTFVNPR